MLTTQVGRETICQDLTYPRAVVTPPLRIPLISRIATTFAAAVVAAIVTAAVIAAGEDVPQLLLGWCVHEILDCGVMKRRSALRMKIKLKIKQTFSAPAAPLALVLDLVMDPVDRTRDTQKQEAVGAG